MAKPALVVRQTGNMCCLLVMGGVYRSSVPSGGTQVKYRCRCRVTQPAVAASKTAISGDLLSAVISTRYILVFRKDNPNVFNSLIQNWPRFQRHKIHMLLILLALCLRKPNGISHLLSMAYAIAGNGCFKDQHWRKASFALAARIDKTNVVSGYKASKQA